MHSIACFVLKAAVNFQSTNQTICVLSYYCNYWWQQL